jgi:hypothetical protein
MDRMCSHFESLDHIFTLLLISPHKVDFACSLCLLLHSTMMNPYFDNDCYTAVLLILFFEDVNNMRLSNCTCLQLAVEGITVPEDFKEFDDNGMMAIFTNLLKPPKVPAMGVAACAAGTLQEIQAYEVSAKSKMRLKGRG